MLSSKIRVLGVFAVILIACAGAWFYLHGQDGGSAVPQTGQNELRRAPAFSLKDVSGGAHTLDQFHGKLLIVHFWAAWCPPCLSEIPEIVEFAEHFKDDPKLAVVAISLDEKWEDAEKVLTSSKLPKNMISLLDGGAKSSDAYGTFQFPETYLINPDGRIMTKWVGGQPWTNPKTIELMKLEVAKVK